MPTVETETCICAIKSVGADDLRHSGIGGGEFDVMSGYVEVVSSAEVVLGTGATDSGEFGIAVHEELELTLAPPVVTVDLPSHIRADVVTLALDAVDNGVNTVNGGVRATEGCAKICDILVDVGERVVYLIVNYQRLGVAVFHGETRALAERHRPIAVEAARGVCANGKRVDVSVFVPAVGEEITCGNLDGWELLIFPVNAEDKVAPDVFTFESAQRQPNVLDSTRAFDVGEREFFAGLHPYFGADLPALTQVSGIIGGCALCCHTALALFTREVFGRDRARFCIGQTVQV